MRVSLLPPHFMRVFAQRIPREREQPDIRWSGGREWRVSEGTMEMPSHNGSVFIPPVSPAARSSTRILATFRPAATICWHAVFMHSRSRWWAGPIRDMPCPRYRTSSAPPSPDLWETRTFRRASTMQLMRGSEPHFSLGWRPREISSANSRPRCHGQYARWFSSLPGNGGWYECDFPIEQPVGSSLLVLDDSFAALALDAAHHAFTVCERSAGLAVRGPCASAHRRHLAGGEQAEPERDGSTVGIARRCN